MSRLILLSISVASLALLGQSARAASYSSGGVHSGGVHYGGGGAGGVHYGGSHSGGVHPGGGHSGDTRPYSTSTYRVYTYSPYPYGTYAYPVYGFAGVGPAAWPGDGLPLVRLHEFEKASGYVFGRPGHQVVFNAPVGVGGPHPEWQTKAGAKALTKWER